MAAAHQRGIVHRDLKPENIVLVPIEGGGFQPKVIDFGIARRPKLDEPAAGVFGTPGYMAPEQALGHEEIGGVADIWSLCAVLYELVSGRTPFRFGTTLAAVLACVREEVTPLGADDGVDADFWEILRRGFEKDPADRWQSMRELGEALARWLDRRGVHDDVSGVSVRTWWASTAEPVDESPKCEIEVERLDTFDYDLDRLSAPIAEPANEAALEAIPIALVRRAAGRR